MLTAAKRPCPERSPGTTGAVASGHHEASEKADARQRQCRPEGGEETEPVKAEGRNRNRPACAAKTFPGKPGCGCLHRRWAAEASRCAGRCSFSPAKGLADPEMRRLMQLPRMRMLVPTGWPHCRGMPCAKTARTVEQGGGGQSASAGARPAENSTPPGRCRRVSVRM